MDHNFEFTRWVDIELFHNLVKFYAVLKSEKTCDENIYSYIYPAVVQTPIEYRGKVKLHGSNGAVVIQNGQVKVQSRNQFIESNTGLGKIVHKSEPYFKSVGTTMTSTDLISKKVTIFGEFCGPKVQKGVALAQLKTNIFAVFAIEIDDGLIIEPGDIEDIMTNGGSMEIPESVYVIPWHTDVIVMPLTEVEEGACADALARIEVMVNQIDKVDPWVEDVFGITGPGEGLVLYPCSLMTKSSEEKYYTLKKEVFGKFAFKAKGEQHRVVATKTSVQVHPTASTGVMAFVDLMCPEARLVQGAGEVGGVEMKLMKAFINWVVNDVAKEGQAELEVNGADWAQAKKEITKRASQWYSQKAKEIGT